MAAGPHYPDQILASLLLRNCQVQAREMLRSLQAKHEEYEQVEDYLFNFNSHMQMKKCPSWLDRLRYF